MRREDLTGTWAMEREAEWPSKRREEIVQQALEYGLESACKMSHHQKPMEYLLPNTISPLIQFV